MQHPGRSNPRTPQMELGLVNADCYFRRTVPIGGQEAPFLFQGRGLNM
jgi:hypothetical protein